VASGDVGSFAPLTLGRTNLDVGQVDVTIEKKILNPMSIFMVAMDGNRMSPEPHEYERAFSQKNRVQATPTENK
jgi:hypothetical protein